ncbi:ABC transporter permease [Christensenella tenuis]|uniref:ABC transporter permease n=1 Tax=Christensenella tenuis TaxID=2763033 RepID=A0ABR7EDP9_9FIRM|nr:ABC transporter permease [Christensenella tenuis]MBC5647905.1 ABC transporter permease [Christensenella tenuis]
MIAEVFHLYVTRWDFFAQLILQHLQLSFIAIGLAALIGIFFGIVISEHAKLAFPVLGVTNLIYTIPSIAMLGFLVPATGIGDMTAVIALTVYGLLPMVRNTHTGIKGISPVIIEAGKGMGSTKSQLLFKIKLPLAMPVILAGARNMIVMTIALCGIASFVGAGGLGVAIYRGITTNNMAMTVAGSLLIAGLALIADLVAGIFEKKLYRKINGKGMAK